MIKLLKPRLKPMAPKLKAKPVHETPRLRGRAGVKQRERRLLRTNYMCEMCMAAGAASVATVVDHIVPLAHGGSDEDSNTRNLCDDHHRQVTAEQFGHKVKTTPDRYRRRPNKGAGDLKV